MGTRTSQEGFTIVELLIVIVVIGILAAITIVSFNGVTTRAKATAMVATMKSYKTALMNYSIDNGAYPTAYFSCLGSGYKDYNSDGTADCGDVTQSYREQVSTSFNTALKKYLNNRDVGPAVDISELTAAGNTFVGGYYGYNASYTLDGASNPYFMLYVLPGDQANCGLTVASVNGTYGTMVTSSNKYSWYGGGATMCFAPLPNPS